MIILNYSNGISSSINEAGVPTQHNRTGYRQLTKHPDGTKKRRMLCIVVSCLPAVSERLMLLEYQNELNFAPGVEPLNVGGMQQKSAFA